MDLNKNNITLKNIHIEKNENCWKVIYEYSAPEKIMQYVMDRKEDLFVEFPMVGNRNIPTAVLTIPFVGIMLTAAMLLDVSISVDELDENFYGSLQDIERVFQSMYHTNKIKIQVLSSKIVACDYSPENFKTLFFTGGVDATSALISTLSQAPILLNIWGGDLRLNDNASHQALDRYLSKISLALGLKYCFIKTNAREYFNENELCGVCLRILGRKYYHDWWASIAHILSMTTSIAPFLYSNRIGIHYIGSSYEIGSDTFDSNNSQLINVIKYCSCNFTLVDDNIDRNEKVKRIIEFEKNNFSKNGKESPLELKVCWFRRAGENCCECEKCYRTIMNIIVNHGNPNKLGFTVNKATLENMRKYLLTKKVNIAFWSQIQQEFQKEEKYWESVKEISWILHIKINSYKVYLIRLIEKFKKWASR